MLSFVDYLTENTTPSNAGDSISRIDANRRDSIGNERNFDPDSPLRGAARERRLEQQRASAERRASRGLAPKSEFKVAAMRSQMANAQRLALDRTQSQQSIDQAQARYFRLRDRLDSTAANSLAGRLERDTQTRERSDLDRETRQLSGNPESVQDTVRTNLQANRAAIDASNNPDALGSTTASWTRQQRLGTRQPFDRSSSDFRDRLTAVRRARGENMARSGEEAVANVTSPIFGALARQDARSLSDPGSSQRWQEALLGGIQKITSAPSLVSGHSSVAQTIGFGLNALGGAFNRLRSKPPQDQFAQVDKSGGEAARKIGALSSGLITPREAGLNIRALPELKPASPEEVDQFTNQLRAKIQAKQRTRAGTAAANVGVAASSQTMGRSLRLPMNPMYESKKRDH